MSTSVGMAIYDPRRLDQDTFLAGFVARGDFVEFLLDKLRHMPDVAEHHIVVGPRGMGKTSLLRRLAIGIASEPALRARYIPLTFREEQYNVRSLDAFWRNCGEALAEWCENEGRADAAAELDRSLLTAAWHASDSAAEAFLQAAGRLGGRPVLFVDNLDLILDALGAEQNWALRRILQAPGGPVVFGAATQMLRQSADRDAAFYEFFQPHLLEALSESEVLGCMRRLADARGEAGQPVREILAAEPERIRTLHTLTGGNPRVLTLVYQLLERSESNTVFSDLEVLLDQLTPYYKARIEEYQTDLQRAVIDAIALNWDPITSHDLGEATAVDVTTISSQLARLRKDGLVEEVQTSGARAGYQLVERFFNIWYLMRHGTRRTRQKIRWLTAFLTSFYGPAELIRMRSDATDGRAKLHPYYREALEAAGEIQSNARQTGAAGALEATASQVQVFDTENRQRKTADPRSREVQALISEAIRLGTLGRSEEAIAVYDDIVIRFGAAEEPGLRAQVARALVNKGFTLGALGRNAEEMAVYDDVVIRFGAAEEPDLRAQVARALFNKGVRLGTLGRSEEAIAVYDDVVIRFGAAEEPDLRAQVAGALFNKGVTLGDLGRSEEAIAVYDDIVIRFGAAEEPDLRAEVAGALFNKGVTLGMLGRSAEEIAVYDDVVIRFGAAEEHDLQAQVARALVNEGFRLGALGRSAEAMAVYDDVVIRFGAAAEPDLRTQVALALFNKGLRLGALGRSEQEIAVYDDVVIRFGAAEEPELRGPVARALVNKGVALGTLGRSEEAIAAYDDVVIRFGAAEEPGLRADVGGALVNKGVTLGALGRSEEEMAVYDDVVTRFGAAEQPELRTEVARALVNKGARLGALGRSAEAIAAYDDVVIRFGAAAEPELRSRVARALVNKGGALVEFGRSAEAIAVYNDIVIRFGAAEEPDLRAQVARALLNKGATLGALGRSEEEIAVYDDVVIRFGAAKESDLLVRVARALVNKGDTLGELGRSDEAVAAYNDVVIRFGAAEESELRAQIANALFSSGNILADHLGQRAEAEAAYRLAMSTSTTELLAEANLAWLLLASGRTKEAANLRNRLADLHPVGLQLLDAAFELVADNFGAATAHLNEALSGDRQQLDSTFSDDLLRLLRLAEARSYGEKLIAWFVESGQADRLAPVYAAFVGYVRGDRYLLDFSPEVRKPAEQLLGWLGSLRKLAQASEPAPPPKRRRGRPPKRH